MPGLVLRDVVRNTKPDPPLSRLLTVWWAAWASSGMVSVYLVVVALGLPEPAGAAPADLLGFDLAVYRATTPWVVAGDLCYLVAGVALILLMLRLTAAQDERYAALTASSAPVAVPRP